MLGASAADAGTSTARFPFAIVSAIWTRRQEG